MSQDPEWMQIYVNVVVTILPWKFRKQNYKYLGEMMEKNIPTGASTSLGFKSSIVMRGAERRDAQNGF